MKILEGTFKPPKGTNPATVIILKEIARIWRRVGEGEVNIVITKEDFQHYWRRIKERTVFVFSGQDFGHYTGVAHPNVLSEGYARHLSLITKKDTAPKRWYKGL